MRRHDRRSGLAWVCSICGLLAGPGVLGGTDAAGASPAPDPATTLLCNFKPVQLGQFQGLRFINGEIEGAISLTLVASAADRQAGRAVVIDDARAAVVAMIVQARQTLFVDSGTPNDATLISVFTNAQAGAAIPATYSRHLVLGAIPIVSQYTGSCTPQS